MKMKSGEESGTKTVLFVCFHNAGRSQMAEAFVNQMARERNLPIRAISAGTVPSRAINPVAVAVMEEIGFSMADQEPKHMMEWDINGADRIITMHCRVDPEHCPKAWVGGAEDWNLPDPADQPIEIVRQIRDQIRTKVEALLEGVSYWMS